MDAFRHHFLVPWEVHVLDMAEQAALSSAGAGVFLRFFLWWAGAFGQGV